MPTKNIGMAGPDISEQNTAVEDADDREDGEEQLEAAKWARRQRNHDRSLRDHAKMRRLLKSIHGLRFKGVEPLDMDAFPTAKTATVFLQSHRPSRAWTAEIKNSMDRHYWLDIIAGLFLRAPDVPRRKEKSFQTRDHAQDANHELYLAFLQGVYSRSGLPERLRIKLPSAVLKLMIKVIHARVRHWKMFWKDTSYSPWDEIFNKTPRHGIDHCVTRFVDDWLCHSSAARTGKQYHFNASTVHRPPEGNHNPNKIRKEDVVHYCDWLLDMSTAVMPRHAKWKEEDFEDAMDHLIHTTALPSQLPSALTYIREEGPISSSDTES